MSTATNITKKNGHKCRQFFTIQHNCTINSETATPYIPNNGRPFKHTCPCIKFKDRSYFLHNLYFKLRKPQPNLGICLLESHVVVLPLVWHHKGITALHAYNTALHLQWQGGFHEMQTGWFYISKCSAWYFGFNNQRKKKRKEHIQHTWNVHRLLSNMCWLMR